MKQLLRVFERMRKPFAEGGKLRAYGAGLLSSFGELEHALSGEVEVRAFDPMLAKDTAYPITTYQPLLWSVSSIREAFDKMDEFVRFRS